MIVLSVIQNDVIMLKKQNEHKYLKDRVIEIIRYFKKEFIEFINSTDEDKVYIFMNKSGMSAHERIFFYYMLNEGKEIGKLMNEILNEEAVYLIKGAITK